MEQTFLEKIVDNIYVIAIKRKKEKKKKEKMSRNNLHVRWQLGWSANFVTVDDLLRVMDEGFVRIDG